jgi:6-phosphogluconate dehydrogenase
MGANLVRRLQRAGHQCVVHDLDPSLVEALVAEGATGAASPAELVDRLDAPRAVWVMVPAGVAGVVLAQLGEHLEAGDVVVDGGNSWYRDDIDRSAALAARGVDLVDCGTSGGVWGAERGYCLMVGGPEAAVARLAPVFSALAPGVDAAPRTRGRTGPPAPAEEGWLHCGPVGAGHFVKMVHNGIEYALMAAYAEGFNLLAHADDGREGRALDAETTPLRDPAAYRYDIDLAEVAEVWRRGSVIGSWLLDLTAGALHAEPGLDSLGGRVSDSGEGRWTAQAAIDVSVPVPVLSAALFARFSSRGEALVADKLLSAMRREFGGHHERPPAGDGEGA